MHQISMEKGKPFQQMALKQPVIHRKNINILLSHVVCSKLTPSGAKTDTSILKE